LVLVGHREVTDRPDLGVVAVPLDHGQADPRVEPDDPELDADLGRDLTGELDHVEQAVAGRDAELADGGPPLPGEPGEVGGAEHPAIPTTADGNRGHWLRSGSGSDSPSCPGRGSLASFGWSVRVSYDGSFRDAATGGIGFVRGRWRTASADRCL